LILVDTSLWVDHLRRGDPGLVDLPERSAVAVHPFVIGEIACGSLRDRDSVLGLLQDLPAAVLADNDEVLHFIARHALHGMGIGYVDMHLLASVSLTERTEVGACNMTLRRAAERLGLAYQEPAH
jgi:predicted nucleic acid-binding protein